MNILFITGIYPQAGRNSKLTKVGHNWTKKWVEAGHSVTVVADRHYFFTKKSDEVRFTGKGVSELDGVKIIETSVPRFIPRKAKAPTFLLDRAARRVAPVLAEVCTEPDVVFVDFCATQWAFAKRLCAGWKCPMLPIFHDCDVRETELAHSVLQDAELVGVRSRKIAEGVRALSPEVRMFHAKSGAVDGITIPDGELSEKADRTEHRIIYVGTLIKRKKADTIIRALSLLRDEYSFHFTIIGSGECEAEFRALTGELKMDDLVEFIPWMPREQVLEYMRESDCFVMPSYNETFGIVYVEAMASGCYTIGSRGEGIDGTIKDGHNGALVEPGSVESLAAELRKYFEYTPQQRMAIMRAAVDETQNETEAAAELLAFATGEKAPDVQ